MPSTRITTPVLIAVLTSVAILGAGSPASASGRPPTLAPPNIVVLMVDDMPERPAIRLFKRLPHIRELFLEGGQRWTNMYANDPLCCPGRASFLTGLWSRNHGVTSNTAALFQPDMTVATALHDRGYWTAIAGKYFNKMGGLPDKTPVGWDRAAITSNGYWTDWWIDGLFESHRDPLLPEDYHTDILSRNAVSFLRDAPQSRPVFMFLTPYAVHGGGGVFAPPSVAPRHQGDPRCESMGRYRSPAYAEADISDKPGWVAGQPVESFDPRGWPLAEACRSLLSVDEMLAEVIDELGAQGRLTNTMFVLTADNGMGWGDNRLAGKAKPYATHLPLWMRWDAYLDDAPSVIRAHASMVDLAPTIAHAAGATLGPYPTGQLAPDGLSLLPTMETGVPVERDALLEEHVGWSAVRTTDGRWQYVEYDTGERELYDLTVDPWRLENVAGRGAYVQVQSMLAKRLAKFP